MKGENRRAIFVDKYAQKKPVLKRALWNQKNRGVLSSGQLVQALLEALGAHYHGVYGPHDRLVIVGEHLREIRKAVVQIIQERLHIAFISVDVTVLVYTKQISQVIAVLQVEHVN